MTSSRPTAGAAPGTPPGEPQPWQHTARSALALLRERAWLGALLGVVVLSCVFVFLGRWQFTRHETRTLRADRVSANYDAAPAPLTDVLRDVASNPTAPLPPTLEWRAVRVSGTYLADATVLLRNRPRDGDPGYEVVVPMRLDLGPVLLVNRGWVPAGATGAAPDAVPPPPSSRVEAVVRLRPSEPANGRSAPPGQAYRINAPQLAEQLDAQDAGDLRGTVVGAYGVLDRESPTAAQAPVPIGRPDPGLDINLPYAVQWWAFAIAGYVLLAVGVVREARRRNARPGVESEPKSRDEDAATGSPGHPGTGSTAQLKVGSRGPGS